METKKCTKCGEVKALGEFYKSARMRSGLRAECKECGKAAKAVFYAANREKENARSSAYYEANHGKCNKKRIENLTDAYVANVMCAKVGEIPPELIEAKRQQIMTHRAIKQLQSTLKEKEKP